MIKEEKRGKYIKTNFLDVLVRSSSFFCIFLILMIFVGIVGFVFFQSLGAFHIKLFSWHYNIDNLSLMPALINSVILVALSLVLALPLGVACGVYLAEFAKNSGVIGVMEVLISTLSGVPSIVFGLFGYLVFVIFLGFGFSLLSGVLTLFMMIFPLIVRTTQESLMAVNPAYREGGLSLGASRIYVTYFVLLPSARNGIGSGVMLSVGRVLGESAALIFTAGTLAEIFSGPFAAGRSLSVHLYALLIEGLHTPQAYASASVLIAMSIVFSVLSHLIKK